METAVLNAAQAAALSAVRIVAARVRGHRPARARVGCEGRVMPEVIVEYYRTWGEVRARLDEVRLAGFKGHAADTGHDEIVVHIRPGRVGNFLALPPRKERSR